MKDWKKVKWVVLMVLALTVMVAAVGCGKSEEPKTEGNKTESAEKASGTVKIAGSTSVQPLAEELAQAFGDKNPDIKVDVAGGGSSAGVKAAQDKTANIGTSSRELKEEEKASGLTETVIAKDGIAVVTHPNNKVAEMTLDQIKKIYTGEITNWKEVGGKDAPITVVNRDEASGTRGAFEEIVLGKGTKFVASAVIQNSTGAVRTAVSQDENAIGYISMGSLDNTVKAVKVEGVEATEANVLNGTYKISRPFLFLTSGAPDAATQGFIDFVLSADGQKIVAEEFVPVK